MPPNLCSEGYFSGAAPSAHGCCLRLQQVNRRSYRIDKCDFPFLGRMIVEQTKPANVTV